MLEFTTRAVSRTLTLAAIGAAAIMLSGCSILGSLLGDTGVVEGEGERTDVFAISVGDCLNDASAGAEVTAVPRVDCAEPHDSEVYYTFDLADGDFPGEDAVYGAADEGCIPELEKFVGIPYVFETALVDYSYYVPTETSWETGDREVACLAISFDESGEFVKSTGTLEGAAR